MKLNIWIAAMVLLAAVNVKAQAPEIEPNVDLLKEHVYYLASDELEGRETSTEGERLAAEYISKHFEEIGLDVLTDDGSYLSSFTYVAGKEYEKEGNFLKIGKQEYKLLDDYYALNHSGNGKISAPVVFVGYGVDIEGVQEDYKKLKAKDLKGKVFAMDYYLPDNIDPHSEKYLYPDLRARLDLAKEKGAVGVVFINMDDEQSNPKQDFSSKVKEVEMPVIFVKEHVRLENNKTLDGTELMLGAQLKTVNATGFNVAGFLDNNAEQTVVIGAHYDHLGWGGQGSLFREKEIAIHNGADDNGSGTAALIEMARILSEQGPYNNNYLFLAFSGEEMGLYGSKSFVEHPLLPLDEMNYMLNMDMIGRLDKEEKSLALNGTGTSPNYDPVLDSIQVDGIKIMKSESGIGPSDHTSFYLKDIPVIHFFTGTHADYHKPSDDADLVNYEGIASVMKYMYQLIYALDDDGELEFTKTKDDDNENAPKFTVTLGVIPDYMYDGDGMRIDGVTEGKPASNAGIIAGDVVVQMGELEVVDMMSYMKGLSMFKKGDTTMVSVMRDGELKEMEVTF